MKKPNFLGFTKQQQNFHWPVWFPYPTSWLRAFILVIVAFPGTSLIVFGLVGIIISILGNSPLLLILSTFFGLLLPTIVLTFLYHICWFIWQKKGLNNKLPKWIPRLNSLWDGFYGSLVMALSFLVVLTIFTQLAFSDCRIYYEISSELSRCAGRLTGRATKIMLSSIENNNFVSRPWFIVWVITASYLYQIEYLVRKHLITKLKIKLQKFKAGQKNYSIDNTDQEIDRLRGDLGLTQMKKGRQAQTSISPQFNSNSHKHQTLNRRFLLLLLICLSVIGGYSLAKFTYLKDTAPFFITSQILSTESSITPESTTAPVNSELPTVSPQSDNFRDAVNQAISAANLTQSAKSQTEWQNIVKQWEAAISMMQSVPLSSPNYAIAQQKIIEYQRNLSYAQKNATNSK